VTIASNCLPDSDNELKPYIRLSGKEGIWTAQQQLTGKFRPGQPDKFRFNGADIGEIDRVQIGIEEVNQLESVYNNAQVDACWIISQVVIQVVCPDDHGKPQLTAQYKVTNQLTFNEQQLVHIVEPDSCTDKRINNSKMSIIFNVDRVIPRDKSIKICIHSETRNSGLIYLHGSMAYYPVENDQLVLGYRLLLPDEGKIDKIDVVSESVDFELKHVQIIKENQESELFIVNYSFDRESLSRAITLYPEHDETVEYEMQLHLHHQKSRLTEHDVVRMKIFNESDFVEVSLKSFTPMGRSVYKLRFESKKIGTVEGIQFLNNHEVDPIPEWIINNVRIMCNGFSYEFIMDLYLPDLRHRPDETKVVFMNSIMSDYQVDPDSLKLEIMTGSNFAHVYTIMTLEFMTLKGHSTGMIEIPAEEYRPKQHKIYNIGGIKLNGRPLTEVRVNCPNRVHIQEIKVFNPSIHDTTESFEIDHIFPGEKKSSITSKYSKYTCSIQTSNRDNAELVSCQVFMQCIDANGVESFRIECGDHFERGSRKRFEFDMKKLDVQRIRLWTENRDRKIGGHAWHLEKVELVDNSWYKDGIHRRFYTFNANQWIMDNEVELCLTE